MKKGKVQTNDHKVNVLVEHEDGNGRHISHLDFPVECEKRCLMRKLMKNSIR